MKYVLALLTTLALSGPALAQHAHATSGPNGGQMEDVAGVHAELMTSGNTITINVLTRATNRSPPKALPRQRSYRAVRNAKWLHSCLRTR